jgi:hypothetical protein
MMGGGMMGGGMMGGGMRAPEPPTEKEIDEEVKKLAEEKLKWIESQHKAYRYIVGVYQSSDYHMETLQKIYQYYQDAANEGDPIAQYHLALFIRYLGDIVDPFEYPGTDECESAYKKWLEKARMSDMARERVEKLEEQITEATNKKERRDTRKIEKLVALKTVEDEKLEMYDDILIRVRARIGGGGSSGTGGTSGGMGTMGGGRRGGSAGGLGGPMGSPMMGGMGGRR